MYSLTPTGVWRFVGGTVGVVQHCPVSMNGEWTSTYDTMCVVLTSMYHGWVNNLWLKCQHGLYGLVSTVYE